MRLEVFGPRATCASEGGLVRSGSGGEVSVVNCGRRAKTMLRLPQETTRQQFQTVLSNFKAVPLLIFSVTGELVNRVQICVVASSILQPDINNDKHTSLLTSTIPGVTLPNPPLSTGEIRACGVWRETASSRWLHTCLREDFGLLGHILSCSAQTCHDHVMNIETSPSFIKTQEES